MPDTCTNQTDHAPVNAHVDPDEDSKPKRTTIRMRLVPYQTILNIRIRFKEYLHRKYSESTTRRDELNTAIWDSLHSNNVPEELIANIIKLSNTEYIDLSDNEFDDLPITIRLSSRKHTDDQLR